MTPAERDPIALFLEWQREARDTALGARGGPRRWLWALVRWLSGGDAAEEGAAALATSTPDGRPSVRMVLVKGVSAAGFVFYTSYTSRKGEELAENPRAALVFHWAWPPRQVRVEGTVSRLSAHESDAYWRTRRRGSQLAAAASEQSAPIPDRAALLAKVEALARELEGRDVPRPSSWGGYRLVPATIELWEGRADRLHERTVFRRAAPGEGWRREILQP